MTVWCMHCSISDFADSLISIDGRNGLKRIKFESAKNQHGLLTGGQSLGKLCKSTICKQMQRSFAINMTQVLSEICFLTNECLERKNSEKYMHIFTR